MKHFLVFKRISLTFAFLTRVISLSTLEIDFIFPHNHELLSLYITAYYNWILLNSEYVYNIQKTTLTLKIENIFICTLRLVCSHHQNELYIVETNK